MKRLLSDKTGESHIKTAVMIITAIVIGGLVLGGVYALYQKTILPKAADEVESMMHMGTPIQVRRLSGSVEYSYDGETWKGSSV